MLDLQDLSRVQLPEVSAEEASLLLSALLAVATPASPASPIRRLADKMAEHLDVDPDFFGVDESAGLMDGIARLYEEWSRG